MATVKRFEDLEIWQLARLFYQKISLIAKKVHQNHEFRLADQIRSAAGSAMDNIAEGFGRSSRLEFVNALSISKGESSENQSQLYRLLDDGYISQVEFDELYRISDELARKLASFIQYLNASNIKGMKFKNTTKR